MGANISKYIPNETAEAFLSIYRENKKSWLLSVLLVGGGFCYFAPAKMQKRKQYIVVQKRKNAIYNREKRKKNSNIVTSRLVAELQTLLKIAVPFLWCKEVFYVSGLVFCALIRTSLSIRIAHVNGTIVKTIVTRQFWPFVMRIATLGSIAIPASFVNSMLSYFTSRLALQFRTRLVHHFHDIYCSELMYYKVSNIDHRIESADQVLTKTLTLWSTSLSELFTDMLKALLDIVLFSKTLADSMGWQGPAIVVAYYMGSMATIRILSPPFGALATITQNLEYQFRSFHRRLITHGEEIAFYGGDYKEKQILNDQYHEIYKHREYVLGQKFGMKAFNGFLQKYGSVMCGYSVLGLPVFGTNSEGYLRDAHSPSDIAQDYIRNSSLLINLSKAIGRIVTLYEDIQRLAGYTKLVSNMKVVLRDLEDGNYVSEMVLSAQDMQSKALVPNGGEHVVCDDYIEFDRVSVITPNGDVLVNQIQFTIRNGENLMIAGPNGCGKSSLFRMLGKLWPLWNGKLYSPEHSLFYIAQKPYLCVGTLKDQLIYPDTYEQSVKKGWTQCDLFQLLENVKLSYLVQSRGFDSCEDWFDVLSGGEKQRIAMARIFYHKPKFAILDECTSAVSVDLEDYMYQHCKTIGITLITISHRPSLWKHHQKKLYMDGRGNYEFGDMVLPKDYS
eukprot:485379_1